VRSGDLIREARLRAGLSQHELAARSGRERSVIARWEQGAVAPSIETLLAVVRACGYDLPLELVEYDTERSERLQKTLRLSPERRLERMLKARAAARQPAAATLAPSIRMRPWARSNAIASRTS